MYRDKEFYNTQDKMTTISKEETNYLRIANLLMREAPRAVRVKFDYEIHPIQLQTVLNQNRLKVQTLRNRGIINQKQWDHLFPRSGCATSTSFDLTLMIALIRNLTQTPIGDILPHPADTTDGAELTRIKLYRNKIFHNKDGSLDDLTFNIYWEAISQAIVKLGGNLFIQICADLKVGKLDENDKELITECRNMCFNTIPKPLNDVHGKYIKEWETFEEKVVKTRAIKCLLKLIEDKDVVTVVGSSGSGKTTAVHHVALQMQKLKEYDIVPAQFPQDIIQYCNTKIKQVFVYEDICGKYSIQRHILEDWSKLSNDIKEILKCKNIKILSCCRTDIFRNKSFVAIHLLSESICDLLSPSLILTSTERMSIAKKYLNEEDAQSLYDNNLLQNYDMFPLLCKFYSMQNIGDVTTFFSRPVQVINEHLATIMNLEDQTKFATLALFVVYNNMIKEDILCRKSGIKSVLEYLSDELTIPCMFSPSLVRSQIELLTNSFVKKCNDTYSIIHDKLFDILVSFCGEHLFDFVLDCSCSEIIRDRFYFQSIEKCQKEDSIAVYAEKEIVYFERLFRDVQHDINNIFENKQLQCKTFRTKFLAFLRQHKDITETLFSLTDGKMCQMIMAARRGYSDIVEFFINLKFDVNICDTNGTTPLLAASGNGNYDVVRLLLENKAICNCVGEFGFTPLLLASWKGFIDIVQLLLHFGADPNLGNEQKIFVPIQAITGHIDCTFTTCTVNYTSPLFRGVEEGHTDIVKILLKYNADVDIIGSRCMHFKESPLYVACQYGLSDITQLLLDKHCDPNGLWQFSDRPPPLYIACRTGRLEIVRQLLDCKADCQLSYQNEMLLHAAVSGRDVDILRLILSKTSSFNARNNNDETPLFMASQFGMDDMVELLLQKGCDINISNTEGTSPLLVASSGRHPRVLKLLLEYGSNPNIQNERMETPLFIACYNGNKECVQILLNYGAQPNLCGKYSNRSDMFRHLKPFHRYLSDIFGRFSDTKKYSNLEYQDNLSKQLLSPLFISAAMANAEVTEILLKNGADQTFLSEDGESSLFVASREGQDMIVKLLLEHGSDPNICNKRNESSLYVSSANGHFDVVKLLLKYKCNPNIITYDNDSALCVASRMVKTKIVQQADNITPAWLPYREIVKLLMQYNTDIRSLLFM